MISMDQMTTLVQTVFAFWLLLVLFVGMRSVVSRAKFKYDRFSRYLLMISLGCVAPALRFIISDDRANIGEYGFGFPWLNIAGIALVVLGVALNVLSVLTLDRQWSPNVEFTPGHVLVQHGIYKYIRHPIYAAIMIQLLGFCLALSNWLSYLLIFAPTLVALGYRIYVEEKALIGVFGDQYRSYMRSAKRLIPKII